MRKKIIITLSVLILAISSFGFGAYAGNITEPTFTINMCDFAPGGCDLIGATAEDTVDNTLEVIMTKLIVAFGVCSLFIMTVGGGYMIIYHGQDDLLTKGKSIFMAGLISLAIALGAGLLVQLVAYLLYKGT